MKFFWKKKIQKKIESTSVSTSVSSDISEETISGKKRAREEDEISSLIDTSTPDPLPCLTKWSLWYTLVKVNLEQMDCCRRLSELLGISINHVTQAGIKDRRGYTIQKGCLIIDTNDLKLLRSLPLLPSLSTPSLNLNTSPHLNEAAMRTLALVQEKLLTINTLKMKTFLQNGSFDRGYSLPLIELSPSLSDASADSLNLSSSVEIGMAIGDIEFKEISLSPGDLLGNRFNILLRNVTTLQTNPRLDERSSQSLKESLLNPLDFIRERLLTIEQIGFPNFFGTQRMGIVSVETLGQSLPSTTSASSPTPLGPVIGKYLMMSNATSAVYCILSGLDGGEKITIPTRLNEQSQEVEGEGEGDDGQEEGEGEDEVGLDEQPVTDLVPILQARSIFLSGASLSKVYQLIPQSLTRERKLVKNLIRYSPSRSSVNTASPEQLRILWEDACCAAIRGLPYTTKQLWLSSYQSWLWNKVVDYYFGMRNNSLEVAPIVAPLLSRSLMCPPNVGDVVLMDEKKSSLRLVSVDDLKIQTETNTREENLSHLIVIPMIGKGWTVFPENHVGR
jgi:tRNA(Glu) U13 pseudouridine synthase TruD